MKILVISDDGVASGYGRITMEVNTRLHKRGYEIMAASIMYDGLLPATLDGTPLPYWVAALAGKPNWLESAISVINAWQPDIIHVVQDAPYAEAVRNTSVDWSRYAFVVTTPVDGAPVHPNWIALLKAADGALSISQFGVDAHRAAGVASELCRPGVDPNAFFAMSLFDRTNMRHRLGIAADAFVVGTMATNQGRKDIPDMLRAFFAFASDKPTARYLMDMERTSPAGWDIPALCAQQGWDASKLIFRDDAVRAGIVTMRARYNVLDSHMVISHREGYGLPLCEAMACGVVSIALDYCSGTEICNGGKGILIPPIAYDSIGTWGGAVDKYPQVDKMTSALQMLYDNPDERRAIAKRGMEWARAQTWDHAADAVARVYERVMATRQAPPAQAMITPPPLVQQSVDGIMNTEIPLLEHVG